MKKVLLAVLLSLITVESSKAEDITITTDPLIKRMSAKECALMVQQMSSICDEVAKETAQELGVMCQGSALIDYDPKKSRCEVACHLTCSVPTFHTELSTTQYGLKGIN